jgi:hypothetical protein
MNKIIIEILLNHPTSVTATDNKFGMAIGGVAFHDMPQNRFSANFNHRFRSQMAFFGYTGAHAPRKNYNFHSRKMSDLSAR